MVTVEVRVPAVLRAALGMPAVASARGTTVAEVLTDLDGRSPGVLARLVDDSGLRRFVNVYVGGADVRFGAGLATSVAAGDVVTILPAGAPLARTDRPVGPA